MANEKEIKIRAILDDTGFDQKIRSIQQKLQQMNRMQQTAAQSQSQYGAGSKMSGLSNAFFGDFNKESIGNLREAFNLNSRKLQHEEREMKKKQKEMRDIQKIDQKMTEGQKDRLKGLKDEIDLLKQKGRVMLEENQKIATQAQSMGSGLGGFKGVGGPPQPPGRPPGFLQRAGGFGRNVLAGMGGGSALGGLAAAGVGAAGMGSQFMSYQMQRDTKMMGDIGAQTQGANIDFQHMMQNKGFMNQFERPERRAAMDIAMSREAARRTRDPLKAAASIGGSALAGAGLGAAAGSFIPGIGTGLGAAAGGALGAGRAMLQPDNFRQIFDRDAYNADVRADTMKSFRGNMTAMRMQDPGKFAAGDMFGQRMPQMQGMQRALNLSDRELLGTAGQTARAGTSGDPMKDFGAGNYQTTWNAETGKYEFTESEANVQRRQKQLDADRKVGFMERSQTDRQGRMSFSQQRIRQNTQQMLAGGGTGDFAGAQGMGGQIAAEYQRAGFTGAAGQLGGISGAMTPQGQVESQYKKMVAEAMRMGLDSSDLSDNTIKANESSRRILGAFVQMYSQTAGAEGAVSELGRGIVGGGGAEMAGAESVFNRRNQEAGQGSGYRGALKWAYLNSGGAEDFKGVSEDMKSWATTANMKNLDEDSMMVRELAEQMSTGDKRVSPKEAVARLRRLQRSGENYSAATEKARTSMTTAYKNFLGDRKDSPMQKQAFARSKEGNSAMAKFNALYYREREDKAGQDNAAAQQSNAFAGMGDLGENEAAQLDLKLPTGDLRAADVQEGAMGADQAAQLDVLNKHLPELVSAAKTNAESSIQVRTNTLRAANALDDLMKYINAGGDLSNENINEQFMKLYDMAPIDDKKPSMGNKKNKN